MGKFTHFHVHSQYSILDGAASIAGLVTKAVADGMPAIALTDHGNMFGIKFFHDECCNQKIKPVLGVEAYVARVSRHNKEKEIDRSGEHLVLLAKNKQGYRNLTRLCSIAHTEGFYYRPRVDKELLERYREGLIVSSACLGGEISQRIMRDDIDGAEEAARWYQSVFGEDYYLEVMRHPSGDERLDAEVLRQQRKCIPVIMEIGRKLGIKVIATNDVHFLNADDAEAHDILICLNTGKDLDDPNRMRYTRQEWFKTTAEMEALFADMPEVLENTMEIAEKVEEYELNSAAIMPVFPIPESFGTEKEYVARFTAEELEREFEGSKAFADADGRERMGRVKFEADYLEHLTWIGARKRWKEGVSDDVRKRIEFELHTIKMMGFPGYFLIVQDFIQAAREMQVIVGPGRGSAAGSVVAYCLEITNIDPVRYELLFERFLNPDRVSMPDMDIDFDDDGRQQVMEWVARKYGQDKVAHIVTFGTMAAKMAIKDVARVLRLELAESNRLSKLVPDNAKTLKEAFANNGALALERHSPNPMVTKTLELACALDGTVRQPGVHACGVIISRDPLLEHVPVMPTKDDCLLTTQYDGHLVESIGLLKMDFLGLKTLSVIKICLENIKRSKGISLNIDEIPLDDAKTFELFSRGETTAIFQFESDGMKKHLRALQPDHIEFLVAMNALYRPGPLEYIPDFINRRHGREAITYDHPLMEPFLKSTYGITVYQEQVMLLSRALAGFTRGQSDTLRKAMGKKKKEGMEGLYDAFREGCRANPEFVEGCRTVNKSVEGLIDKIWDDWMAFAQYAFNKSHSVCYAYLAYQTGYLKANYPSEFMAANLSCNLSQIDKVAKLMDECTRMKLRVLPPDVNESEDDFTVNKSGDIRFGLAAIKGVGSGAVEKLKEERAKNGVFKDLFDFFERVDYRAVNKKTMESLVSAGGLDSFEPHRAQYFFMADGVTTWLEQLINYGQKIQLDRGNSRMSLFGGMSGYEVSRPAPPACDRWMSVIQANKEKELIGIYLTSHPLDSYRMEIMLLCKPLNTLVEQLPKLEGRGMIIAGVVIAKREGKTRKGKDFGILTIEDYHGSYEIAFFGDTYMKFRNYFLIGASIYARGRVEKQWGKSDELEFKVTDMRSIELLRDLITSLTIEVNVRELTKEMVDELHDRSSPTGGVQLNFFLRDEEGHDVKVFSRRCRVDCSKDLYEYFEQNEAIKLKID
ncbi:MAG: DNA polymerase III subunit alpha [Odoribacteraceae bacterium]|jgi:DNA polymerase-3 subunit alpha|nr:DNA polymerase III subunit alpha [Odoribacteraceae bacterium]